MIVITSEHDRASVIAALGPKDAGKYGVGTWSLAGLQTAQDVPRAQKLSRALGEVFEALDIKNAYAPQVSQNSAYILTKGTLRRARIDLGGRYLWRNPELRSDGIFLDAGDAFIMSAAGCPAIIATAKSYMVVAHAGRDSLIDRQKILRGKRSRWYDSVVDAIVDNFRMKGVGAEEIILHTGFAIPSKYFWHDFDHIQWGFFNRKLLRFFRKQWPRAVGRYDERGFTIDLSGLIKDQAVSAGIKEKNVITGDSLERYPELAHTRDGKDPARRNLIIIKRVK